MTLHLIGMILDLFYVVTLMFLGFWYSFKLDKIFEGVVLVALSSIYCHIAFGGV
jgi:hypothetical protein